MAITLTVPSELRGLATPLRALVRATLAGEGRRSGDIGLVLTDDAALRALNREWRGIDRATDVISFAYDEAPDGRPVPRRVVNGDLAISMDRTREQARRFRVTLGQELARLVIHGTLHLAGRDHQRAAERREMRAREERALRVQRGTVTALDRILRPRA